jgi:hypothetical protein
LEADVNTFDERALGALGALIRQGPVVAGPWECVWCKQPVIGPPDARGVAVLLRNSPPHKDWCPWYRCYAAYLGLSERTTRERMDRARDRWDRGKALRAQLPSLSTRIIAALIRGGSHVPLEYEDLLMLGDEDFLAIRNVGPRTLEEIRRVIPEPGSVACNWVGEGVPS